MKKSLLLLFILFVGITLSAQNLVAHYPLNGDGTDISGNGLDGITSAVNSTEGHSGNSGQACEFTDGSFIQVSDTSAFNFGTRGNISIAYWFKTGKQNVYMGAIANGTAAWASGFLSGINWNDAGNVIFGIGSTGFAALNDVLAISTTHNSLHDSTWHHIAMVADATNNKAFMYLDGQKTKIKRYDVFGATGGTLNADSTEIDITGVNYRVIPTTDHTGIGRTPFNQQFYGSLDEMYVYNDALNEAQILALYNGSGTSTYISKPSNENGYKIYPNPTSGKVDITNNSTLPYQIELIDISGKTIQSTKVTGFNKTLDIGNNPKGVYILKCQNNIAIKTMRIVLR